MFRRVRTESRSLARRAMVRTLALSLVQVRRANRLLAGAGHGLEGLALAACDAEELGRITDHCYAAAAEDTREGLFEWEAAWFARDLPAAPANVLVGGCGTGRELRWLAAHGYEATGFDPVADPTAGPILRARYEDLLRPDHPATVALWARAPFDAIVLGWGSFSHVPRATQRLAILRALHSLTEGPVLLSYWSTRMQRRLVGRARSLGESLGNRLRAPAGGDTSAADCVAPHCGYAHCFSEPELAALAGQAGYRATCHTDVYGHATLTPMTRPR